MPRPWTDRSDPRSVPGGITACGTTFDSILMQISDGFQTKFPYFLSTILLLFWEKNCRFSACFFMVFSDFFPGFFTHFFQIFADFLPAGYERSYVTEWTLNARPADQFSTIFRRFFRDFSALFRNFSAENSKVFSLFFMHFLCTFWRKNCAFFCTFLALFFA